MQPEGDSVDAALQALFKNVENDDVDEVRRLVDNDGVNVNGIIRRGTSALVKAVQLGHADMVEALIEMGADVNFGGRVGVFPLFLATRHNKELIVDLLLAAGAKLEMKYVNGYTALLEATHRGWLGLVKRLITAGSDVMARSNGGDTGLHIAASTGNQAILLEYLAAGVPVDILHYDGMGRKKETSSGLQPLHLAAYGPNGGHAHIAEILLAHGADINAKMLNGRTALNIAAKRNATRIAEVLLAHNCELESVSMENDEHKTPLHNAIDSDALEMVDLLVDAGADLEAVNQWGLSPLMSSIYRGRVDTFLKLLQAGANINHRCRNGMTIFEASFGHHLMTLMLLEAGCVVTETMKEHAYGHFLEVEHDLYGPVCNFLDNPRSLRQVCRLHIRSIVGNRPNPRIAKLPVPVSLQNFLKLEALDEICLPLLNT